jgi:hypothetical protein
MDIQLASHSQACPGIKLIVNQSRVMKSVKSYLKKIRYFNALFSVKLDLHNYFPFTLIIIIGSNSSLTDC